MKNCQKKMSGAGEELTMAEICDRRKKAIGGVVAQLSVRSGKLSPRLTNFVVEEYLSR
jgi:hypothetical protein